MIKEEEDIRLRVLKTTEKNAAAEAFSLFLLFGGFPQTPLNLKQPDMSGRKMIFSQNLVEWLFASRKLRYIDYDL